MERAGRFLAIGDCFGRQCKLAFGMPSAPLAHKISSSATMADGRYILWNNLHQIDSRGSVISKSVRTPKPSGTIDFLT